MSLPPHNLIMWQPATSEPDSMVWPYHTSSVWPWPGMPKVRFVRYSIIGLQQRYKVRHTHSLLAGFPICGLAYLSLPLEWRRWQKGIALVGVMVMPVIIVLGVQIPALGERAWLGIIISHMMVVVAPAAKARARTSAQWRS